MNYTDKTESYNERRYGKPWMAIVTTSLTREFQFIDWDGRPGSAGEFNFSAEPGTMVAYGQKDNRKGRGGVDGYQICMPDGSMPVVTAHAAELRKMSLTDRWKTIARWNLEYAVNRPTGEYEIKEWAEKRNGMSARYSAMLGVPDPVLAELADALGLGEPKTVQTKMPIDMSAFGL